VSAMFANFFSLSAALLVVINIIIVLWLMVSPLSRFTLLLPNGDQLLQVVSGVQLPVADHLAI